MVYTTYTDDNLRGKIQNHAMYKAIRSMGYNIFFTCLKSPIHHINIYKLNIKMTLKICTY